MSIDRAALLGFSGGGPFALAAATRDWATRVGVVSTVVPPAETGLSKLSKIPFALRLLFRLSDTLAAVIGPEAVRKQYTDRSVTESVSQALADDFHEALRQGTRAVARENKSFATNSLGTDRLSAPVRAWHGTQDENTPVAPVEEFLADTDGVLVSSDTDHLGTLLDARRAVFEWLSPE
jgi:pimeloyl-ACP methyl ester carboxylesterase